MTIYADQMFVENFIMNFIILYMTARFLGIEWRWYKLSFGSSLGALYVILSYVFLFYNNPMILAKVILSFLMVYTSFTPKCFRLFFRMLIYFYIITLFIGGVSFGLSYFFNVVTIYDGGVFYVEEFPVLLVALGTVASFVLGKYVVTFVRNRRSSQEFIYKVRIKIMDKILELDAFYDSGHSVHEPFTNYPVVIVERSILEEIIPSVVFEKLAVNEFDFDECWKSRVRVIPISTISSEKEVLAGFKTDEFFVCLGGQEIEVRNVVVAICDKKLSKDGAFRALLGRDIME